jgi:hypothetical protein
MNRKMMRWIIVALVMMAPARFSLSGQEAPAAPALDAAQKQAIVDEISRLLNENYIFPETAKKLEESLRAALKSGGFNASTDALTFAQTVHVLLRDVSRDLHMRFAYNPAKAEDLRKIFGRSEDEIRKVRDANLRRSQRHNFGFRKMEHLQGNIGYVDFRFFALPEIAGPTAIAAMNFLAYCDAIIIDLRANNGGSPAQVQLISSYFFDEPTHLNDLYYRAADLTENYWTLPYVPGPRPDNADLYILTSSRTFSGAEEFTYNMKNLKRATVIGETTGGAAHPSQDMIVQKDFILHLPIGRAINPVTKTNWEGTGVAPDIPVPAAEALDAAYALAIERLSAKAVDPQIKAEYEWIFDGIKARKNPAVVDEKTLKTYAGVYGDRKITFENGFLYYQRLGPKCRMFPMNRTLFGIESVEELRIEFQSKNGKIAGLIGHYSDGTDEPSPRTN